MTACPASWSWICSSASRPALRTQIDKPPCTESQVRRLSPSYTGPIQNHNHCVWRQNMGHDERPERTAIREHMIIDRPAASHSQGERIPVYDPATAQLIAHQPEAGARGVDRAVRAARQALEQGEWAQMLHAQRERLLLRLADLVEQHGDELARLETLNNGKLLFFSYGLEVAA